jgi:hypothetical protein
VVVGIEGRGVALLYVGEGTDVSFGHRIAAGMRDHLGELLTGHRIARPKVVVRVSADDAPRRQIGDGGIVLGNMVGVVGTTCEDYPRSAPSSRGRPIDREPYAETEAPKGPV